MSKVYDELGEIVELFRPVCEVAYKHLYLPMTQGLPLQFVSKESRSLQAFLQGITPQIEADKPLPTTRAKRRRIRGPGESG
jgi:hypothetical protein